MIEDLRDSLFKLDELPSGELRIDRSRVNRAEDWPVIPHFHEEYEIVVYHDIKARCTVNGDEVELTGGQVIFFPPYTMHHLIVDKGVADYTVLQFSSRLAQEIFGAAWCIEQSFRRTYSPGLFAQLSQLIEIYESLSSSGKTAKTLARSIILWLFEQEDNNTRSVGGKSRFQKLLEYLHKESIYSLNGEDAAVICGVSRPHFMNSFKQQFQITYNDFLVQRKIGQAKKILLHSERKSADIASELGFDDPSYFVKVFKKVTGMTPKKFRDSQDF